MNCTVCNIENPAIAKFCKNCGAHLKDQNKICPNNTCKFSAILPDALYCPNCGTYLHQTLTEKTEQPKISIINNKKEIITEKRQNTTKIEKKNFDEKNFFKILDGYGNFISEVFGIIFGILGPVLLFIFIFRGCK